MHRYILHNDEILEAGSLALSAGQVGLFSGWGVFSTLRVYDGVPFEYDRHEMRMRRDAALLRIPFPAETGWLEPSLLRLVEANGAPNCTLRVYVVRNKGGLWEGPDIVRDMDVVAFTADVNDWGKSVRLALVPNARHAASRFAGTKITSWSANLTWYEEAHESGYGDALLLNERGEVSECTSANIFSVFGNTVCTPPLSAGCLPGVTREVVLGHCPAPGYSMEERTILPADLERADEVFITSTTRELLPVDAIEGLRIRTGSRRAREILQTNFSAYVENYVAARRVRGARV